MSQKQNLYTGRSGQMAVMAEFLRRGYNVAIPEIDVGEDIFVVRDADGELWRIQVKAAISRGEKTVSGRFNIPLKQLIRSHDPELFYVLALHNDGLWREFVVIRRDDLESLHVVGGMGHVAGNSLVLYVSFADADIICSGISLQEYRGNWSNWPPIAH